MNTHTRIQRDTHGPTHRLEHTHTHTRIQRVTHRHTHRLKHIHTYTHSHTHACAHTNWTDPNVMVGQDERKI